MGLEEGRRYVTEELKAVIIGKNDDYTVSPKNSVDFAVVFSIIMFGQSKEGFIQCDKELWRKQKEDFMAGENLCWNEETNPFHLSQKNTKKETVKQFEETLWSEKTLESKLTYLIWTKGLRVNSWRKRQNLSMFIKNKFWVSG